MEYEPLQPYFLLASSITAGCKTFVDVGSNIGAYSVLMSQVPSLEKTVAFEANQSAAREMRANFQLNSLDVDVQTVAVSDQNGTLNFGIVSRLAGNSAIVDTSDNQSFREVEQVECVTLDDALEGCSGPFGIKIDVEGMELDVLNGARETIARERPVLIVEILEDERRDDPDVTREDVLDAMRSMNYEIHTIDSRNFLGEPAG